MALRVLHLDQTEDARTLGGLLDRLRSQSAGSGELAESVAQIIETVRTGGDEAVAEYMRKWTDPAFSADRIRVTANELAAAEAALDPKIKEALAQAIENVRAYQQHVMPTEPAPVEIDGATLGMKFTPIRRAGLAVPGGTAAYPSTVVMTAVPAQVAGVEDLVVACPPPTGGGRDVSPLVLGVCSMLKIEEVYRIGGAQAMAALAHGTETIKAVDFIAGPGNAFVQQAKRQLFGVVGIDGFYGPSEVVVLADASADPAMLASDLLAQAEHDPGCCFLVSDDRAVIDAINEQVEQQLPQRTRRDAITAALNDWSAAVCCASMTEAIEVANTIACEHVTLATADPQATLAQMNHGGAYFLGDQSPVASGDYYAGPSHCLPTGTTARFTSGISVYTFLKRSSVEGYPDGMPGKAIDRIDALAQAEGLDAHAASVRARRKDGSR